MAVTDVAGDALGGHFQQAGKSAKVRRWRRVGSGCFIDEAHNIVTVSIIVDSGDPCRIHRYGKGDDGEQY